MKNILFFSILHFLFLFSAYAQRSLHFEQLTEENGLSNGFVTSIYQDEKGFLWFGTANGLNRYDGYQFKTWAPEENNLNSLSHAVVWTLYGSTEGAIWIGTDKGLNRFDPQTEKFTRYFHHPDNERSLGNDLITAICEDKEGNLWVGTGNGLSVLRKGTDQFSRYFWNPPGLEGNGVRSIVRDEEGGMWFGIRDTLYCVDAATRDFRKFALPFSGKPEERSANFVKTIMEEEATYLWLSTGLNGIYHFDKKAQRFAEHFKNDPNNKNSLSHNRISSFLKDDKGNLWIGTYEGGLNILSPDRRDIYRFQPDPFNPVHQNFEVIRNMLQDRAGNIWLGAYYGGAKVVLKHKKPFRNYFPVPGKPGSLGGAQINVLTERTDGRVWVPVDGWGLALFDPQTETFSRFASGTNAPGSLGSKNVLSVIEDRNGDVWAITFTAIWKMDGKTGRWSDLQPKGMPKKDVWLLSQFKDRQGTHWIGTQDGLFQYDEAANTLVRYPLNTDKTGIEHGNNAYIESFFESDNGDLWIATHGGLNYRQTGSDQFQFFPFHQQVLCIHQDKTGTIWLGTIGGLAFFNPEKQKVEFHPKAKKLSGKLVHSLLEDSRGKLWMGSQAGLICFDPATGAAREYNQKDGLINRQFFGSRLETQSGEFYFGGTKGLLRFHPDSISDNPVIPPVVLTNFQLLNKDMPIRGSIGDTLPWPSPLEKEITYIDTILLRHWQNDFAFEFAALDFTAPMNNRYRFMLEGYDTSWIETNASRRFAHYTNLQPGRYTFKVSGSNSDGKWNDGDTSVYIRISPPWWLTWWACMLWAGMFFGSLFFIRRYELRRRLLKAEARHLLELDAVKSRLYTNITHEFRTPLTVILGIAGQLQTKADETVGAGLTLIHRNGRQLLNLVNQMLDLARLESGALKLNMIQGDLPAYLRYLAESFHSLAESKRIRLHFLTEAPEFTMDFEPLRLQQIISNLLSNAFKFTPEGGDIYLFANKKGQWFEIKVSDTGIGIPEEKLPHVFDRFFQVDDAGGGTGIGLALTKELVLLMKGEISVSSKPGGGTEFTVLLPITRTAEKQGAVLPETEAWEEDRSVFSPAAVAPATGSQAPLLLLVEDNHDVVKYLLACLNSDYRIEVAYNGRQGVEKAVELTPDLIVSDVMMPQMDGFELCHALKTDKRTSHIPIILLTARADMESKLSGLRRGADAYLAKPFDRQELLARIQNLLEVRRKLYAHYLAQSGLHVKKQEVLPAQNSLESALEHDFIRKVKAMVEEDLGRQWTVPELARQLHVSMSQLHRKLEALTGMHATEFIRYVRLSRAADLLRSRPEEKISAIAYEVGFTSPNEFTRRFGEVFGMTPGEWRRGVSR